MARDKIVRTGLSMAREIAEDAAGALAKKADDWGWKGAKPGEISGTEFMKRWIVLPDELQNRILVRDAQIKLVNDTAKQFESASNDFKDFLLKAYNIDVSKGAQSEANVFDFRKLMRDLRVLENAGVPRRWTGKMLKAVVKGKRIDNLDDLYDMPKISEAMESLSEPQRKMFVGLFPSWEGEPDQLGEVVRVML